MKKSGGMLAAFLAIAMAGSVGAEPPAVVFVGEKDKARAVFVMSADGKVLSTPAIPADELSGALSLQGWILVTAGRAGNGDATLTLRDLRREDARILGAFPKFGDVFVSASCDNAALIGTWNSPAVAVVPLDRKGAPAAVWTAERGRLSVPPAAWCGSKTLAFLVTAMEPGGAQLRVSRDGQAGVVVEEKGVLPWLPSDPSGKRVAYLRRTDKSFEVCILDPVSLKSTVIKAMPAETAVSDFDWMPDGSRLTLSTNDGVVLLAPDGAEKVLLGAAGAPCGGLAWSPDGSRLWLSSPGKGDEILAWILTVEGAKRHALGGVGISGDGRPPVRRARWSPDGAFVAFERDYAAKDPMPGLSRRGGSEIFMIAADGTRETKLREGDSRLLGWLNRE